jgi:hypothetical protein
MVIGIRHADDITPSNPQKLALTYPKSGGRLVSMEFSFLISYSALEMSSLPI